jgi:hyperosmotically inducible periplasmic protein
MKKLFLVIFIFILGLQNLEAADLKKIEHNISDTVITAKIAAQFAKNKNLNPLKISVSTVDGVVTLKGNVKDNEAFVETLRIAKNTKGVKTINTDDLSVKVVNTAFTDAYITAKVETAILKAKVLDDENIPLVGITVSTQNGIVTIKGQITDNNCIEAILARAYKVHGVKKIISKLSVKPH